MIDDVTPCMVVVLMETVSFLPLYGVESINLHNTVSTILMVRQIFRVKIVLPICKILCEKFELFNDKN